MAFISQIKLSDTTYDISAVKLKNARTISLTGSVTGSGSFDGSGNLSIATTTNHTHNYAGSSSAGGAANSANKLATARTIGLDTGVTSTAKSFDGSGNITIPVTSIKESYLSWGGKNFNGTYGCIDAAMVSDLGANRLMFGKSAGITIQYSRDGGSTWIDYGASDSAKVGLFSSGYGFNIGKATKDTLTTNCMLRVIINTDSFGVYTTLNKFVIYLSTNGCGGCYCTIDASLENSPTTFTTFANKVPVSGWSGYNVINIQGITTYGNSPSSQYGLIRFTFGCTSVNTNYTGLSISQIMGFGGVGWSTPSTMAKTGHLYSYDSSQNATFPATVIASTFRGALSGNASSATKLATARTISLTGSVTGSGTFDGSGNLSIATTTNHNHNLVLDSGNSTNTTFAYSKSGLNYSEYTWLAGWNGYELRAVNKAQFAQASHTHNYAGSSSAGGSATSAVKLDTATAGDSNTPVYFSGGKPVACTSLDLNTSGNAASASKVKNKLTVGSKTFDGSSAVTIAASDLGLASAMLFLGTSATAITDGATTNPITVGGTSKTVTAGNVVLYGSKEFVWTGSAWEELGNEGSYKIVQAAVADPSASGTSNSFIATISQDTNGKITVSKKTVAVTNSAPTLSWGTTSTIGTVAGTNLQVKMPANPNTDTKVTQTVTTSNAAYPLLLAPNGQTATATTTSYFDSGVTLNPSTNTITANISGNAATASKLGTSTIGSNIKPIYLNGGTATACSYELGANIKAYSGSLSSGGWATLNGKSNAPSIAIAYNNSAANWNSSTYSASLVFGCQDTRGLLDCAYNSPIVTFGGCSYGGASNDAPTWYMKLSGTNGKTYTLPTDSKTLCASDGANASGTWGINVTGSAGSVAWGNITGKPSTFTPSSHTHSYLPLSGGTMTGTIIHGGENGTTTSDSTGAALLCGYGSNTGIFHGNGDSGVESLGTSATANLIIKSWYGVGFADGGTGNGITVGINCRTGRVTAKSVYGAVWNDYAEFRICNEDFKPGQVVLENGDDTLSIASKRLQRGCSIVSDTFGFAIGETDEAKCPIAVSGRVLAYGYESREEFKKHIGWPVCSGPNGTVSIMTEEEEEKYPSRIIGTISAVPDYDTWGTGNVEVNNRIWIKVK